MKISLTKILTVVLINIIAAGSTPPRRFPAKIKYNPVIINQTNKAWLELLNEERSNQIHKTALAIVISDQIMEFKYLQSKGWNKLMDNKFILFRSKLLHGYTPTNTQINSRLQEFHREGINISKSRILQSLTITPRQAQDFYKIFDKSGMRGIERNITSALLASYNSMKKSQYFYNGTSYPGKIRPWIHMIVICGILATSCAAVGLMGFDFVPPVAIGLGACDVIFGGLSIFGVC